MKVKVTKKGVEATILNTLEAYLITNREVMPEKDAENLSLCNRVSKASYTY